MRKKLLSATALALAFCLAVLPVAYADSNSCNTAKELLMNCLTGQCDLTEEADILDNLTSLTGNKIDIEALRDDLSSVKNSDKSSLSDLFTKLLGTAPKADPVEAQDTPDTGVANKPETTAENNEVAKDDGLQATPDAADDEEDSNKTTGGDVASASQLEQSMVAMVNEERAKVGKAPLKIDATLTKYARQHSQDMAENNYFSHTSPNSGTFQERVKAANLNVRGTAENIARYSSVEKAHVGLMTSDGHRKNIMGNFTHIGIGIVWDSDKSAYCITQWFGID